MSLPGIVLLRFIKFATLLAILSPASFLQRNLARFYARAHISKLFVGANFS